MDIRDPNSHPALVAAVAALAEIGEAVRADVETVVPGVRLHGVGLFGSPVGVLVTLHDPRPDALGPLYLEGPTDDYPGWSVSHGPRALSDTPAEAVRRLLEDR